MIVLHVCHTPPFPFLLGYASCLHVTCKDNVLPVQRGLRGNLKTFLNFFFSPPQVANGAQVEGLERWDAAWAPSAQTPLVRRITGVSTLTQQSQQTQQHTASAVPKAPVTPVFEVPWRLMECKSAVFRPSEVG